MRERERSWRGKAEFWGLGFKVLKGLRLDFGLEWRMLVLQSKCHELKLV